VHSIEVQGIVSKETNLPLVQFRVMDDKNVVTTWQTHPDDARDFAQNIVESAANATYESALIMWSMSMNDDNPAIGVHLISMIRRFRADKWGLPDTPDDWRPNTDVPDA
jgi:hypothetical protein